MVSGTFKQARPIDKSIVAIDHNYVAANAQTQTVLITATFPCTITGLRWELDTDNGGATNAVVAWAIVLLRENVTVDTLAFSDGTSLYNPEQNVLAWGISRPTVSGSTAGPRVIHDEGTTKTMRKLMVGDRLVFISKPSAVWTGDLDGAIQFFCKS